MRLCESGVVTCDGGHHKFVCEVCEPLDITLVLKENVQGSVYFEVHGTGVLNLKVLVGAHSHWKYLWLNQSAGALAVNEDVCLDTQANLWANYGEMSLGKHQKTTHFNFNGRGSCVEQRAAMISFNRLHWEIKANHLAKQTQAQINCNAIVLDQARLRLEVIGKIAKGNSGSKTHQMSRILNLGDTVHGTVYPMLLIDEHDVEASHAASVGQPNEEQVYYLQSRGLSRIEALKLMVMGYLMPIVEGIDDDAIRSALISDITEKVNSQW